MKPGGGRNLAIVLIGGLVAIVLVIVALSSGGDEREPVRAPSPRAPAPVIVRGSDNPSASPALSDADRAAARRTAATFVRSYLPVLYGQVKPSSVAKATVHLRRSLRTARRAPRAVRRRHPRVQRLELTVQTQRSVLGRATVRDGVAPSFAVIFTVERRGARWIVSGLASD